MKECFLVNGYNATIGLAQVFPQSNHQNTFPQYIDQPASEDCHFVASLKELGAIPFCLTNVPQTMVNIVT